MENVVQVENLTKQYRGFVAVNGISFNVTQGEIFGIVGPNGAGKTTTIECLEGLRKPDDGLVRVLGVDPRSENRWLRTRAGMQLQQSNLPDRMKVWEALDLYASFYPQTLDWKELLVQLGLEEKRNTAFAKLSGGQKQRLFVALAMLPDPQVIFLDELTTGLDPQARHTIWELILRVRERGKTILLSTHYMEEAEKLCDRLVILDHGKIVALDSPSALIAGLGNKERVSLELEGALPADFVDFLPEGTRVGIRDGVATFTAVKNNREPLVSVLVRQLGVSGIPFRNLRTEGDTLEDVFLTLTGREMRN